jgi:hypothetical protein
MPYESQTVSAIDWSAAVPINCGAQVRQVDLGELVTHQISLLDAHAVLRGQHSAKIYTDLKNVRPEGFSLLEITRNKTIGCRFPSPAWKQFA